MIEDEVQYYPTNPVYDVIHDELVTGNLPLYHY